MTPSQAGRCIPRMTIVGVAVYIDAVLRNDPRMFSYDAT
jgi:hypothetical protein